jgi:adenosine kinase
MPLFSGPELLAIVDRARCVAVNDYEGQMLAERTGLSLAAIAERVDALIVTMGGDGSVIHAGGTTFPVPAAKPAAVVDPTGCGDAYRAGILYGMNHRWDWEKTGALASVMGSLKIASRGGQNHDVTRETVDALYFRTFGSHVW